MIDTLIYEFMRAVKGFDETNYFKVRFNDGKDAICPKKHLKLVKRNPRVIDIMNCATGEIVFINN